MSAANDPEGTGAIDWSRIALVAFDVGGTLYDDIDLARPLAA